MSGMGYEPIRYPSQARYIKFLSLVDWSRAGSPTLGIVWEGDNEKEVINEVENYRIDEQIVRGKILSFANLKGLRIDPPRGQQPQPVDISGTHLEFANLSYASLERASIYNFPFISYLEGANLQFADLRGAKLSNAHLEGANLMGARLEGADLSLAHLESANLMNAIFGPYEYTEANLNTKKQLITILSEAHLEGADLRRVNLEEADIRRAYFQGAKILYARFKNAENLFANQFGKGIGDGKPEEREWVYRELAVYWRRLGYPEDEDWARIRYHRARLLRELIEVFTEWREPDERWRKSAFMLPWRLIEKLRKLVFEIPAWFLLDIVSKQGTSVGRVFISNAILILVFTVIYLLIGLYYNSQGSWYLVINSEYLGYKYFCTELIFSTITFSTFGFGSIIIPKGGLTLTVTAIESILGYIMLGVLVSVIARKMSR